jgi:Lrp/AsnC family leucine-responsive transcriptional regulator
MDATDLYIVHLLQANGRLSQEQIAREVKLSRPAVHERLKRLEEQEVIRGYKAIVDWSAIDLPMTAFIWVRTVGRNCTAIASTMMTASDATALVEECHRVTGEWCLLLKVRAASSLALQDLLDRVRAIPSVQNTMTTVVLSTVCEAQPMGKCSNGVVPTQGHTF